MERLKTAEILREKKKARLKIYLQRLK